VAGGKKATGERTQKVTLSPQQRGGEKKRDGKERTPIGTICFTKSSPRVGDKMEGKGRRLKRLGGRRMPHSMQRYKIRDNQK